MATVVEGLLYSKEDEWVKVEDGVATIGVTDFAQDSLSDIVFLELPEVGETITIDEVFGVVESVKAAADLFAPASGEIVESNAELLDTPELVNEDPYGAAWMVKVRLSDASELNALMSAEEYTTYCEDR